MDDSDGWRLIRCSGGAQDKAKMNRIMLRFRPIAPKPVTEGSGADGSSVDNKNVLATKGRTKRKYVRVRKNSGYKRKKRITEEENKKEKKEMKDGLVKRVTTLQLLPEKSDRKEPAESKSWCNFDQTVRRKDGEENQDPPVWLNFNKSVSSDVDRTAVTRQRAVESWVTVESVTDTCMGRGGLVGSTDVERMKNLAEDTCPALISDGLNRVFWVNGAFKRMVSQQNDGQSPETIMVWLVIKEKLPYSNTAFTCQVKLQYTWGTDKYSQIVPCDVWRMDGGGFSWRLDVEAALSLGR